MAKPSGIPEDVVNSALMSVPRSNVSPKRAVQKARRTQALAMLVAGYSMPQIGEVLGVTPETVSSMIERTLTKAYDLTADSARKLENARLDQAQEAIWDRVLEGDLRAVNTFLKISDRRAKMNGLDAVETVQVSLTVRQDMELALAQLEQAVSESPRLRELSEPLIDVEVIEEDSPA